MYEGQQGQLQSGFGVVFRKHLSLISFVNLTIRTYLHPDRLFSVKVQVRVRHPSSGTTKLKGIGWKSQSILLLRIGIEIRPIMTWDGGGWIIHPSLRIRATFTVLRFTRWTQLP